MASDERQYCVVHYGEVSLKGKNRPAFTHLLADNIRQALSDIEATEVRMLSGRILVSWPPDVRWSDITSRLQSIFHLLASGGNEHQRQIRPGFLHYVSCDVADADK